MASSARQCGIRAFEIALSGASSRLPKPSRIRSTTGRTTGRTAAPATAGAARAEVMRVWMRPGGQGGDRVSFYASTSPRLRCGMSFIEKNWLLILVMFLSGAMLLWPILQRRFSPMKEVGNLNVTHLINHKKRAAARHPRRQGIRRRQDAGRGAHSAVAAQHARIRAGQDVRAPRGRVLQSRPAQSQRPPARWPSLALPKSIRCTAASRPGRDAGLPVEAAQA